MCKLISPFTMGLYGSPYDYVIHVATSRVPLITSFQPPLAQEGKNLESGHLVSSWFTLPGSAEFRISQKAFVPRSG